MSGLLSALGTNIDEFETYIDSMREYRDKFVAHLDERNTAHIPDLKIAMESTTYLLDYLITNEDDDEYFPDAQVDATKFFNDTLSEGKQIYKKAAT